jgi:hypothetical protein
MSHPDSFPAIARIHWDDAGYLWIEHYVPYFGIGGVERRIEVLRANGDWLGHVVLPSGLGSIQHINSDRIVWTDTGAQEVQYVRIFSVRPRSSGGSN